MKATGILLAAFLLIASSLRSDAGISVVNVSHLSQYGAADDVAVSGQYAYVTFESGLRILDISNPATPVDVGYEDPNGVGGALRISGLYAYLVYGSGASILDLSVPTNPVVKAWIPGPWSRVSVSENLLLLGSFSSGAQLFDVSNPVSPIGLGTIAAQSLDGVAVSGRLAYLAVNFDGISAYDVADPMHPVKVAQTNAAPNGYCFGVVVSGEFIYHCGWTNGLFVYNNSDPSKLVGVFASGPRVDGTKVAVAGNYAYAAGDGWQILNILNVSNPTNADIVSSVSTQPTTTENGAIAVSGGYVYIAGFTGLGIYALNIDAPRLSIDSTSTNTLVLTWPTPTGAFAVQQNPDLSSVHWVTLTNRSEVVGTKNQVILSAPGGSLFYRLVAQ